MCMVVGLVGVSCSMRQRQKGGHVVALPLLLHFHRSQASDFDGQSKSQMLLIALLLHKHWMQDFFMYVLIYLTN